MAARVQIEIEASDAASGVFRAISSELGSLGGALSDVDTLLAAQNKTTAASEKAFLAMAKAENIADKTTKEYAKAAREADKAIGELAKAEDEQAAATARAAQALATMGIEALKATIKFTKESIEATVQYAQEVRDLSLASGQSAEESSRMLQVLDDYQLTADDAKTATRALTKEGLAPTIDTVANLSAEFQKLTTVEDRNAFVQKNLGRAGQEWLNLLSQGPDKIRAMNAAVSESLILTEENVRQAEDYRLALDAWGDAVEGVKVKIGTELLPVLTQMMEGLSRSGEIRAEANRLMQEGIAGNREEALAMAAATIEAQYNTEALQANGTALDANAASAQELAEAEKLAAAASKEMDAANKSFIGTLGNLASARATLNQGMAETDAAFAAGNITIDEHAAKMGELKATYQETINSMVLGLVQFQLASDGAFDDADLNKYLAAGQKLGVFTQGMVTDTKRLYNEAMNLSTGLDAVKDPMLHVGARAEDNAEHFGLMAESGAELGESLRKEVAAGAAAATSALVSIPTSINVDIWIRTHGGGNFLSQFANTTTTNSAIEDMRDDSGGGRQMGGEVFAGVPYNVGEGGMETFVPNANGRIVGHKAALHQAGLMGGGSQRNIFYGPVTLQIGEDSAAGFMSLR
jgi:hypothetical protein